MIVAEARGASFKWELFSCGSIARPVDLSNQAWGALGEVAEWLGFSNTRPYLDTLALEKEAIFNRAQY